MKRLLIFLALSAIVLGWLVWANAVTSCEVIT